MMFDWCVFVVCAFGQSTLWMFGKGSNIAGKSQILRWISEFPNFPSLLNAHLQGDCPLACLIPAGKFFHNPVPSLLWRVYPIVVSKLHQGYDLARHVEGFCLWRSFNACAVMTSHSWHFTCMRLHESGSEETKQFGKNLAMCSPETSFTRRLFCPTWNQDDDIF